MTLSNKTLLSQGYCQGCQAPRNNAQLHNQRQSYSEIPNLLVVLLLVVLIGSWIESDTIDRLIAVEDHTDKC